MAAKSTLISESPIAKAAAAVPQGQTLDTPGTTTTPTYKPAAVVPSSGGITPRYSDSYEKPDISTTIAITNNVYQNLMGRNATQAEIQKYHEDFLKYAASHPSSSSVSQLASGEVMARQSTSTNTGLSETNFIDNLVTGNAESQGYKQATTYFDAMRRAMGQFGGGY